MKLTQYQVDTFTNQVFKGNPAAVCPLENWLEDSKLQSIATENNLSETAFFIPSMKGFKLRWFTPNEEVDLCGHATLATAHIIFELLAYKEEKIVFETRSGELYVERVGPKLQMNFPVHPPEPCEYPEILIDGLGRSPIEVLAAEDYIAVFESEAVIRSLNPTQSLLNQLDLRGIVVTSKGDNNDFVSRYFAPKLGVPEDPVTGSTHCSLTPYWANKLSKNILTASQVSKRGGDLLCELKGERVLISGQAIVFMIAEINF